MKFLLPRESYNLAMLFMCFVLLWWLYEAVLRFLRALKFHAARMADNIVYVPGLGQYSGIFDFVFQDHYLSLRQWHGPVQPDSVDSATVPFDVSLEDSVAKPSPNSSSSSIGCSSSNGNSSNSGGDLGCSCTAASITGVVADISRGDISGNRMCRCVRVRCSSTCVVYVVRGLNLSKLDALLRKQVNIHHKNAMALFESEEIISGHSPPILLTPGVNYNSILYSYDTNTTTGYTPSIHYDVSDVTASSSNKGLLLRARSSHGGSSKSNGVSSSSSGRGSGDSSAQGGFDVVTAPFVSACNSPEVSPLGNPNSSGRSGTCSPPVASQSVVNSAPVEGRVYISGDTETKDQGPDPDSTSYVTIGGGPSPPLAGAAGSNDPHLFATRSDVGTSNSSANNASTYTETKNDSNAAGEGASTEAMVECLLIFPDPDAMRYSKQSKKSARTPSSSPPSSPDEKFDRSGHTFKGGLGSVVKGIRQSSSSVTQRTSRSSGIHVMNADLSNVDSATSSGGINGDSSTGHDRDCNVDAFDRHTTGTVVIRDPRGHQKSSVPYVQMGIFILPPNATIPVSTTSALAMASRSMTTATPMTTTSTAAASAPIHANPLATTTSTSTTNATSTNALPVDVGLPDGRSLSSGSLVICHCNQLFLSEEVFGNLTTKRRVRPAISTTTTTATTTTATTTKATATGLNAPLASSGGPKAGGEYLGEQEAEGLVVETVQIPADSDDFAGTVGASGVDQEFDNEVTYDSKEDDEDCCVVCLTEPKAVLLLPCRHMCICADCFRHVSRCPVCRASYSQYVIKGPISID